MASFAFSENEKNNMRKEGIVESDIALAEKTIADMRKQNAINKKPTNTIHYYELCFYHDEDDNLATTERCSYCIKTEIPPVISDRTALRILFGEHPNAKECMLIENLTCVMEISEAEALDCFDIDELTVRTESEFGVYYAKHG